MLDTEGKVSKLDKAVSAFLALEIGQLSEFCKALMGHGIFVDISVSHVGFMPSVYGAAKRNVVES